MNYKVELLPSAQKVLDKLDPSTRQRVAQKIYSLADNPRPHGYLKLEGYTDLYRIRAGSHRIVYSIEDDRLVVSIVEIGPRDKIYKKR